jgi:poly-gamma-glutamate synthesis protein (capsule biosynthesis protein)
MLRYDVRTTAPKAMPQIQALLKGDVVFTNLEAAVAEKGQKATEGRGFLTPPESIDALKAMGFNLLSLANNHAYDLQATGIENMVRAVKDRGVVFSGAGRDLAEASAPGYLRTTGGATIALISSASGAIAEGGGAASGHPGVNELRILAGDKINQATVDMPGAPANKPHQEDAQRILQSIREARKKADIVIVYQHNHVFGNRGFLNLFNEGLSERLAPNKWLVNWVHSEIDAGADIVVMHGAPLLHGVEMYHGKPIFYDLGNFIFNAPATASSISEPMAWESVVANLQYQDKNLKSIELKPVVMNYYGDGQPDVHDPLAANEFLFTRGLPSAATGAKANYILERVMEFSKPFGTKVEIKGETAQVKLGK